MPIVDEIKLKPYSLTSCPKDLGHYQIVVSKGNSTNGVNGVSSFLHERVEIGSLLEISAPVNGMELARKAAKHVLIAGGMGVTPFLSHLSMLVGSGAEYELHYTCRTANEDVFLCWLNRLPRGALLTYTSGEGNRLEPDRLLAKQPRGTHLYVSGPCGLVEDVIASAGRLGLPADHIHYERRVEINPSLSA